ncbi:MAG: amidohydrolase family protein [Planctomycetota bacterium]
MRRVMGGEDGKRAAIDIHAHIGWHEIPWMRESDPAALLRQARRAGVTLCVASHSDAFRTDRHRSRERYNMELLRAAEKEKRLLVWWVVDPQDDRDLAAGRRIASHGRVVGFKVHPRLHGYPFAKRADEILGLAREAGVPVLTHAGNAGNMPIEIVRAAEPYEDVRIIIAHFGNCAGHLGHVRALRSCRSRNVFTDTSSAVSIQHGIIEMGVREVGVGRFLFGSDCRAYHLPAQYHRIACADLSALERRKILWENAARHILKPEQVKLRGS